MSILERFQAYADAFEEACLDDDWSRLSPYFTEDAVYSAEPAARGRDAVLKRLKDGVNAFDRRMDARVPYRDSLHVDGNTVELKWRVTYQRSGAPDLTLSGVQLAVFEGDRIARLDGSMDESARQSMTEWLSEHG